MKGFSFSFDLFDFSNLKCLIDCFEIISLLTVICSQVPIPQTLEELLNFISLSYSDFLEDHFNQSLSIIIQRFNLMSPETLYKLPNSHLIKIFSSDSLQIESEDYYFN
jgi:hypothetical protein